MTREAFILATWEHTGKDVAGAADLDLIQQALLARFKTTTSPASIARTLADHGARLVHPEILQADTRWREQQHFLTPADLACDTIEAANGLIEKVQQHPVTDDLRRSVVQLKTDLDAVVASERTARERRELAREVAQWLTVWLQNPQIFADWLALRRSTPQFQELFGTFPHSQANTNDQRAQLAHEPEKRTDR
jgi:hypothetical protein